MAVDYFLDIDGIQGESEDAAHKNKIQVMSFSWGASQAGRFGWTLGGSSGKASFTDFSFTMQTSKATTKLIQACASGKHIAEAKLYCRKSTGDGGPQDYMIWTMKPVIVSSYNTGGSSGAEIPIDSVSLNYGAVSIEYKTQGDKAGTLTTAGTFKWDVTKNKEA
ncbi:MAG: type VI secretion system tube protein Hcp [Deltaproteobacteria bacterium]|nr:type VI secretion system tube protein Hcp [Deltaproteobacteria bacterium]